MDLKCAIKNIYIFLQGVLVDPIKILKLYSVDSQ